MPKQKILIPLDGSQFSQQILPQILRFFDPAKHELILFRVAPIPQVTNPALTRQPAAVEWPLLMYGSHQSAEQARHPIYLTQIMDSMSATLENELYPTQLSLQEAGFIVSVVIKFGDSAQEILDFAKEEQIDMITMTTHGRTGLSRLLFGSVAEKILHKATIPVMVLRPKGV